MAEQSAPLGIIAESIRRERERGGLTLSDLASTAGIAKSTLSQLESGSGNPSVETLWALGVALGVPFSRLVDPPVPRVRIIRSGQAPVIRSEQSPFAAALLSSCPSNARRDLHLIELEPGGIRHAEAHLAGTVEHIILTDGNMRVGPEENPVELARGDYVAFSGDVPHRYEALSPATTAVLIMEHV